MLNFEEPSIENVRRANGTPFYIDVPTGDNQKLVAKDVISLCRIDAIDPLGHCGIGSWRHVFNATHPAIFSILTPLPSIALREDRARSSKRGGHLVRCGAICDLYRNLLGRRGVEGSLEHR